MKHTLVKVHNVLSWLLVVISITQFYLIGLSVFGAAPITVHSYGGAVLMLTALLTAIVSLIVRASRWNVALSILVLLLIVPVQGFFVYANIGGYLRSLHAVNGVLILGISYVLANGFARATLPKGEAVIQPAAAGD